MSLIGLFFETCCFSCLSSSSLATEAMTSASTSTLSDSSSVISDIVNDLISSPPPSFMVTPPPTSRSSRDFVYVEYNDYDDYSSYEDPSVSSETHDITLATTITTTTTTTITTTTTSSTTRRPRKTAPPHLFKKKTTTKLAVTVPVVTVDSGTPAPVWTSVVPESPTTADPGDITTTSSGGQNLQTKISLTENDPPATSSPSFIPLSKKENNSVDEVPYRIVGLDADATKEEQNYFVPRMPPLRERTQNKRIQELLNEKRRQDLLRRSSRSRKERTERKQTRL